MVIYLYTGTGAGKTTSALGLALRAIGHDQKVIIIQFMKGRKDTGEYLIKDKIPNYEIHQFGREEFVDLKHPSDVDVEIAFEGLKFAKECVEKGPNMLVLDEINIAAAIGLLKVPDVVEFLKGVPKDMVIVMTGRYAPQEFIDMADYVNEITDVKFPKDMKAVEGIQY